MALERAKNGTPHVNTTASEIPRLVGEVARGNRSGLKPKLARMGLGLQTVDPKYRAVVHAAESFRSCLVRDLHQTTGGCSSAVGSIVTEAALVTAVSRHLYHEGFAAPPGPEGYQLFMMAAKLGEKARQHQLAAWELAAREAQARTANAKQRGTAGKLQQLAGIEPASPLDTPGGSKSGASPSSPHPSQTFPCPDCGKPCRSKPGMQAHRRSVHKKPKVVETAGEEPTER